MLLVFRAAIQFIPNEYYEYAALEGAGAFRQHSFITTPLLSHTFIFAFFIAFIANMKIFKEIFAVAGTYPSEEIYTLQHFINNLFANMNYNTLSAASHILLFLFAVLFGITKLIKWRWVNHDVAQQRGI